MRLLLSSRGLETERLTAAFLSLLPSKAEIKTCIITTASEKFKEKNKHTIALKERLENIGVESRYVDIEYEDGSELGDADVIILAGGNPYYLLHHIKKSGTDKLLKRKVKENCVIYGISAGFLVLQKNIEIIDLITPEMNQISLKDKKGLGLIDDVILPHYDRFVEEGLIKPEVIGNYANRENRTIIGLGELEGIKYNNGRQEKIK